MIVTVLTTLDDVWSVGYTNVVVENGNYSPVNLVMLIIALLTTYRLIIAFSSQSINSILMIIVLCLVEN